MNADKSQGPEFSGSSTPRATAALVVVLTTWPAGAPIETIAEQLVRDGLAACVTVLPPHRAIYRWQGQVEFADEQQLLVKTTGDRVSALEAAIHAAHPYDVPEFLVLDVIAASAAYGQWVRGE